MRWTLANKVSVAVGGVVFLAVFSSMAALVSSWHVEKVMCEMVADNLPSVQAAEELEIAVLEQRGFVSAYMMDNGNPQWLRELQRRKGAFDVWLARAHKTARTPEEQDILQKLEDIYRQYDAKRTEVVRLYDDGNTQAAQTLFVHDVNDLYRRAYDLCEAFIQANERYVDTAMADSRTQVRWATLAVSGCVLLTLVLAAALLWLFFKGVIIPVRAMLSDARDFAGEAGPEAQELPTDELRTVGVYLRTLMSDVVDSRTTLQRSHDRLQDAEKLASVGKLAASVAHEIRNPLTAMKMWLFSIQKEVGGTAALDHKFAIVSAEIRHLESIVRDFLEFSRPPEVKLSVVSVASMLDKAFKLVEPRMADRKIRLLQEGQSELPRILADPEQLKQVFVNLLNNAVEVTDESGSVRVATAVEPDSDGREMVVVRIIDSGPGMPDEVSRRIFEPFFTTKDTGTGLGLCIAARIMARHQGRVVLESSNKQGTTFAVHIPAETVEDA
ncbi:MAG: MCP four helix bundle domain-containing protein [Pirellulales bacterium]|nr:MCP four helix bundle domain-containing protein [Pirellulales bacterium]